MNPIIKQTIVPIILLAAMLISGCKAPPPTVALETVADPEVRFDAPADLSIAVLKLRGREGADAPDRPKVVPREELGLTGRNFVSEIERGLREAGFEVTTPEHADLLAFSADAIISGEYDAYRRIPVHESVHGTMHTRRGFRTFHETITTEVVVPERRRFVDRSVQLSVHTRDPDQDPMQLTPDGPTEIWIGRIRGSQSVVDQHLDAIVHELLQGWGRTEKRRHQMPRE